MINHKGRYARSWLFAPANVARRAKKALNCEADAAVLDLEDAVAASEKATARQASVDILSEARRALGYVRVNGWGEGCREDLSEIVGSWLDGIFVPKAEDPEVIFAVDDLLGELEVERGLPIGSIDMVLIIESCVGLSQALQLAKVSPRTSRLAFGAGDFTLDLGIDWTTDESELDYARFQIAVASKAAGSAPPIDTVFIDLANEAGLKASVARGARWGFGSKSCIHPNQLNAIHEGFVPDPRAVANAREVIAAFETAECNGSAAIRLHGKLVDYAIVHRARDLVNQAEQHGRITLHSSQADEPDRR